MEADTVDLLVIGAGATGACVARDAAMRGLSTILIDKGDFASGASAKSSQILGPDPNRAAKMPLSGLVSAARERKTMLTLAPHLVQPRLFLSPSHSKNDTPRISLRLKMWLADLLTRNRKLPSHKWLSQKALLRAEPRLKDRGLLGGIRYADAICDTTRFVLANVRSAHEHGAIVSNYVEARRLDVADGRVRGAEVVDLVTGTPLMIHALTVVCATGVGSEALDSDSPRLTDFGLHKEVQAIVPRHRIGIRSPMILKSPVDGRAMFMIPTGDYTTVGVTNTHLHGGSSEYDYVDEDDLIYLLRSANAVFPDARLKPEDVVSTWAGCYPVPKASANNSTLEHRIWENADARISVVGGRVVDQIRVAAQVVDLVANRLRSMDGRTLPASRRAREEPFPGGEVVDLGVLAEAAIREGLREDTAEHLVRSYGSETPAVTRLALSDPRYSRQIVEGHPSIYAQLVHAMKREMALTLSDLLMRRLPLGYYRPSEVLNVIDSVADVAAKEMGWDEARRSAELAVYRATMENFSE